jgi:tetratricopeptide (TPR) repeat protein
MKKIILLLVLSVIIQISFAQTQIDSLLPKITAEKDDNIRFEMLLDFFSNTGESNPLLDLKNAKKLLVYAKEKKDKIGEGIALGRIANNYRSFGDAEKSLEYHFNASDIAQQTGNERLVAYINHLIGNVYKDLANYPKAISYYLSVAAIADKLKYDKAKPWVFGNLADVYLALNQMDSAFKYSQMEYEVNMRIHYYDFIGYTFNTLSAIQGKMGNTELANSYFNMSVQEGIKTKSPKQLNWTYTSRAQYFNDVNQRDSSILYAKKAIAAVQNTPFFNYSINPAKLLLALYKNYNSDSALKYSEIYRTANDSVFSAKTTRQTQLLTFENEIKQVKLTEERMKAEEQRKLNIQYALLALCIITFVILFLLLSRSFITNEKMINFFGVIALLIVFEFLNLLLHPFLERVTNHSPVLMLLALVCIAALLVPLHHRVEKWATAKLVEKNKKIRLAAAKKTIEQLEGDKNK